MRSFQLLAVAAFLFAAAPGLAQTTGGTMPTCAAGDPVVWVNTNTKVYHAQGDPYFGKTTHGKYACKSAADTAGNHASKQSASTKSTKSGATGGTAPVPGASAAAKHSWFHKSTASPAASSSTAVPAAQNPDVPGAMGTPPGKHHHHKAKASPAPAPIST